MININRYKEILNEEEFGIRCKDALEEIQPFLKEIMSNFIKNYSEEDNNLKKYILKTHESTLKTTYTDSKNPKYAEKKKNTTIGKKTYVGIQSEEAYNYSHLLIELNGFRNVCSIGLNTDFYAISRAYKEDILSKIVDKLDDELIFNINNDYEPRNLKTDLEKDVKNYINKRTASPIFFIGIEFPLTNDLTKDDFINALWKTWNLLTPLRDYLIEEDNLRKKTRNILSILKEETGEYEIEVYNNNYNVLVQKVEKSRSNSKRQYFHIHYNEQLICTGNLEYSYLAGGAAPYEYIIVNIYNSNQISFRARKLLGVSKVDWKMRKVFAMKDKDNKNFFKLAMNALIDNGIEVVDNEYKIGVYDNENESFTEDLIEIQKRLIKSALIFSDITGRISLPKSTTGKQIIDPGGNDEIIKEHVADFNLIKILEMVKDSQYTFSDNIIRDIHLNLTSIEDKHFVILNGISGTGKTKLCNIYANAVYGLKYDDDNPYFTVIPVRPDWIDSTSLFGYYSNIENKYIKTEFLEMILVALKEREKPHFIVLDEMNLARVEYYLSDYLSTVESKKSIRLHLVEDEEEIPQNIEIPPNVYILGTVNVDETTHSISDKVLDRAFVMTLSDVDLDGYWNRLNLENKEILKDSFNTFKQLHKILLPYELHFGYRTLDEMIRKINANNNLPKDLQIINSEILDTVICEKILPKIRGDERIKGLLEKLMLFIENKFSKDVNSYKHLERMNKELEYYGATQFWR